MKKMLMLINYLDIPSESFIKDEIDFFSQQPEIDLTVLHFGSTQNPQIDHGINIPNQFIKRWKDHLPNMSWPLVKSLRFRNGWNGTLGYLIRYFRENTFDIIYCHFGTNGKKMAQLRALQVIPPSTRLVVRFHGFEMDFEKFPVGFYDILQEQADLIFCGSQHAQNDLKTYGLSGQKIKLLPVGVQKSNISTNEISKVEKPGVFRIISVGRLVAFKGFDVALEVMKALREHTDFDFQLTIIGEGCMQSELLEQIKKYNLQDVVQILPLMPHVQVIQHLEKSHIYLYTGVYDQNNRAETQGLANLEAMAQGLPIVAAAVGGVIDYVKDQETGFLCQPKNVRQFVEKLQYVMQHYDTDSMTTVRQNARHMVHDHYRQDVLQEDLLHLILDL